MAAGGEGSLSDRNHRIYGDTKMASRRARRKVY
jgi:hypothetical protein